MVVECGSPGSWSLVHILFCFLNKKKRDFLVTDSELFGTKQPSICLLDCSLQLWRKCQQKFNLLRGLGKDFLDILYFILRSALFSICLLDIHVSFQSEKRILTGKFSKLLPKSSYLLFSSKIPQIWTKFQDSEDSHSTNLSMAFRKCF